MFVYCHIFIVLIIIINTKLCILIINNWYIYIYWLVALTILKNISQWEGLSHISPYMKWKIKFMFETTKQSCLLTYDWFRGHFPTRQCVKTLYPFCSHQNSWDLWMFIPLKMVSIGIDPYPPKISLFSGFCSAFAEALGRCQVCADRLQGSGTGTVHPGQPWRRSHGGISEEGSFDGLV